MPKQLNIDLTFNANTAEAKAQIESLQKDISSLVNTSAKNGDFGLSSEIREASQVALQLKSNLSSAMNQSTGNLDLSKFITQMNNSGMSVEKYQSALSALGPAGDEAFSKLTKSIVTAETPLLSLSGKLQQFGTTLKNSIGWQLSSSAIHGFMSAVQGAFSYAQNLNESLTNIQIVTQQSSEQMAQFAEKANKAAQALSTTTTAYTDAALIYYQQGLGDDEVEERTNTTIKLANVTGETASEVSSYMTAIWNNYDDGSESLEHYADVITKLGASTASSSSEIAEGLQQFAAVGNTVGLSYDYATSALATVVAQTRQSASTVGNGLRTIFSRLQGLKQGGTDEDGTTLNKYSQALANVGVQIKQTDGSLKDMDNILSELGEKWQGLTQTQKVALAQTVGGVRQYTTLISLMDNWESFQENLTTAQDADGTLEAQAETYADSWEGAQKRVKAAAQAIYSDLIDDKFFIWINNMLAELLKVIDNAIDGIGGIKGVLLLLGSVASNVFSKQIANGLKSVAFQFKNVISGGQELKNYQQSFIDRNNKMYVQSNNMQEGQNQTTILEQRNKLLQEYMDKQNTLNESEKEYARMILEVQDSLSEQLITTGKIQDENSKNFERVQRSYQTKKGGMSKDQKDGLLGAKGVGALEQGLTNTNGVLPISATTEQIKKAMPEMEGFSNALNELGVTGEVLDRVYGSKNGVGEAFQNFQTKMEEVKNTAEPTEEQLQELAELYNKLNDSVTNANTAFAGKSFGLKKDDIKTAKEYGASVTNNATATEKFTKNSESLNQAMKETGQHQIGVADSFVKIAGAGMSLGMTISSITSLMDVWGDESKSVGDKITSTLTSVGMVAFNLTSAFNSLKDIEIFTSMASGLKNLLQSTTLYNGAQSLANVLTEKSAVAKLAEATSTLTLTEAENLLNNANLGELEKLNLLCLARALNIKGLESMSIAEIQAAVSEELFGDTALTTAGKIGVLLAEIAPVIITVIALAAAVYGIIKAFQAWQESTPEGKLKKLQEETENAKTTVEDATTAVTDLTSAWSDLTNSKDTLDGLTKGTTEWYEALAKANEQIINLVDEYPELASAVSISEDGKITLDEDAYKKVLQEKVQNQQAAQANYNILNTKTKNQELQNQIDSKTNSISKNAPDIVTTDQKTGVQTITSKGYNLSAGTIKDIASKLSTDDIKALQSGKTSEDYTVAYNKLNEALSGTNVTAKEILADTKNLTTLSEIKNLELQQNQNQAALATSLKPIASEYLSNSNENYSNLSSSMQDRISTTAAGLASNDTVQENAKKEVESKYTSDDALIKQYATLMGIKETSDEYKDITAETAENYLIQQQALQDVSGSMTTLVSDAQKVQETTSKFTSSKGTMYGGMSESAQANMLDYKEKGKDANFDYTAIDDKTADILDSAFDKKGKIDETSEAYKQLTEALGDNAKAYLEDYEAAEKNGEITESTKRAASEAAISTASSKISGETGVDADRISALAENYSKLAEKQKESNDAAADSAEIAALQAARDLDLNDGISTLYKDIDDYTEVLHGLKEGKKADILMSEDTAETYATLKTNVAKLAGVSEDYIDDDYMVDHMDEIKKAANGDEDAIKALQKAAQKEVALALDDSGILDAIGTDQEKLTSWLNNLPEGELSLKDTEFLNRLVWAQQQAGLSAEEIQKNLSDMGIDVELGEMDKTLNEAIKDTGIAADKIADNMSLNSTLKSETQTDETSSTANGWTATADTVPLESSVPVREENGIYDMKTVTGYYPTVDIKVDPNEKTDTTSTTAHALEVKSANKTSGGKISHTNSKTGRRNANTSRSSRGTRRASRRTASSRSNIEKKTNDDKKKVSEEKERYHTINKQLTSVKNVYDKIDSAADRAFGKSKIKLLNNQIDALNKVIKKDREYLKETQKHLAEDKKALKEFGATYDEYGNISNYDAIVEAQVKKYNSAIDKYNKAVTAFNKKSSDAQEKENNKYKNKGYKDYADYLEKTILDPAEDTYDKWKEALDNYEDSVEQNIDATNQLLEDQREQWDTEFEELEYTIQIKLDIDESELTYLEYLASKIEKSQNNTLATAQNSYEKIKTYKSESSNNQDAIKTLFTNDSELQRFGLTEDMVNGFLTGDENSISELEKIMTDATDAGIFDESTFMDKLKELSEKGIEYNENISDEIDTILGSINTAMENWLSQLDTQNEKLESGLSTMEHYTNIIDILGKKSSLIGLTDEQINTLNDNQVDQKQLIANSKKQAMETAKAAMERAQEEYKAKYATATESQKTALKEQLDSTTQEYESRLSDWEGAVEDALSAAQDAFSSTLESITTKISDNITNLQTLMELTKNISDDYLDNTTAMYDLTKLNREIQASIDDSTTVKAKKQLIALQDTINKKLASGAKISEYEYNYLQKQYEVEKAKIALEEAQNNKSQVKMTRSADGSWDYVYTSDEDTVSKAKQTYEDSLEDTYTLNKKRIESLQDDTLTLQSEWNSKVQDLADKWGSGEITDEEYEKQLAAINDSYKKQIDDTKDELTLAMQNQEDLYKKYVDYYGEANVNKNDFVTNFSETELAKNNFTKEELESIKGNVEKEAELLEKYYTGIGTTMDNAETAISDAHTLLVNQNTETLKDTEINWTNFASSVNTAYKAIKDDASGIQTTISNLAQSAKDDFTSLVTYINSVYSAFVDSTESSNETLYKSFQSLYKTMGSSSNAYTLDSDNNKIYTYLLSGATNAKGEKISDKTFTVKSEEDLKTKLSEYFNSSDVGGLGGKTFTLKNTGSGQVKLNEFTVEDDKWKDQISLFDTGGYTGKWGDEGKLAMLHEKELVLNKQDTSNFLKAIGIVKQISSMIDLNAAAASNGIANIITSAIGDRDNTLQQQVTITAEFPNVTNKNEILEAFENLRNRAVQYIGR